MERIELNELKGKKKVKKDQVHREVERWWLERKDENDDFDYTF